LNKNLCKYANKYFTSRDQL